MNVTAYQEKEMRRRRRAREGQERKRATEFEEAACCPSAVVQGPA